jgi:ribosomal protein S18 acetylase RimI-like enzyme
MNNIYNLNIDGRIRAVADLCSHGNGKMLQRIHVPVGYRGLGHGSALLKTILADADREGISLYLCIIPKDGGLNELQLRRWYERYGFVEHNALVHKRIPNLTLKGV